MFDRLLCKERLERLASTWTAETKLAIGKSSSDKTDSWACKEGASGGPPPGPVSATRQRGFPSLTAPKASSFLPPTCPNFFQLTHRTTHSDLQIIQKTPGWRTPDFGLHFQFTGIVRSRKWCKQKLVESLRPPGEFPCLVAVELVTCPW